MTTNYSSPDATTVTAEIGCIICQSSGITGFTGPDDLTNPSDPYNYTW